MIKFYPTFWIKDAHLYSDEEIAAVKSRQHQALKRLMEPKDTE